MKKDIHPTYHIAAKVSCSCGNVIVVGSTQKAMLTELCSSCHPLYTGKKRIVDTAGKVEKFEARAAKSKEMQKARKKLVKGNKTKKTVSKKAKKAKTKKETSTKKAKTAKKNKATKKQTKESKK